MCLISKCKDGKNKPHLWWWRRERESRERVRAGESVLNCFHQRCILYWHNSWNVMISISTQTSFWHMQLFVMAMNVTDEWSTIWEQWLTLFGECSLNITHTWHLIICSCARLKLLQTIQSFFNICFCHCLATVWHKVVLFGYADESMQCCIFIGHCCGWIKPR